jgi:cytoskeletal protein RodZ
MATEEVAGSTPDIVDDPANSISNPTTPSHIKVTQQTWADSTERRYALKVSYGATLIAVMGFVIWAGILFTQGRSYERAIEESSSRQASATREIESIEDRASSVRATMSSSFAKPAEILAAQEELKALVSQTDKARSNSSRADADYAHAKSNDAAMSTRWWVFVGSAVAAALLLWILSTYLHSEKRREYENLQLIADVNELAERSDDPPEDPFALRVQWAENQKQLQHYHQIVLNYATSTRQTTLIAIGGGFVFLVIISIIAISARDIPSALVSSVVTAAAAAVTGFVARAVLRNSETSSREMIAFFSHPLEVQRLLAAERVAQGIPVPHRHEASMLIVSALTRQSVPVVSHDSRDEPKMEPADTTPVPPPVN